MRSVKSVKWESGIDLTNFEVAMIPFGIKDIRAPTSANII
jgi:hypothetical protein